MIIRATLDNSGATAIEYALIGVLVAITILTSVTLLGTSVSALFQSVANTM